MDLSVASGSVGSALSSKVEGAKRKSRRTRGKNDQRFANYLVFGLQSTLCLGLFVVCYALVLIILWPLLSASTPESMPDETPRDYLKHMHVPPSLKEIAVVPGKDKLGEMAKGLKQRLEQFRQGRGVTDAQLLHQAAAEFDAKRKERRLAEKEKMAKALQKLAANDAAANQVPPPVAGNHRNGFIVLGMHRSGTSMVAGLLHQSAGYTVGGPLIGSAFDNEKGFFERIDIVLQNDEFMSKQNVWWSANVINYDWEKAIRDKDSGVASFEKGKTGLQFMDDPNNSPWLQKDPRMCITLKTWLKLMRSEPAILFTYRNPLEVALSLHKREKNFPLEKGLRLWIVYNMRAIQNSRGLCMVKSSNDAILADPLHEIQRISDELTESCGVPAPPNRISQEHVDKFIDPALQHGKRQLAKEDKQVLETYNNGECKVYTYTSEEEEGTVAYEREHNLYRKAMKIYCDFQSGAAYKDDYEWPNLA
jgi:hypothetical protein